MSSKIRLGAALLALSTILVGTAGAGTALAGTAPVSPSTSTGAAVPEFAPFPVDFVDLPEQPLPAFGTTHSFTISYHNSSSTDRTVSPQVLVESQDTGPFLNSADIRLERRGTEGCWESVSLESQTGTLFTDLVAAQRTLHPGESIAQEYRLTTITAGAVGTVHPRVALYE
ncbi:hypothetical protein [Streptomyces chartreusis]|uniref:Signal peptide protein n=1 Tax=Streptomyces chartreusis TaxID=1969 RepID=A0A7H8TMW9_STRCX|nr:hypothetical protein [Streptomyces chartreusis]QKZ23430.1 signal peptide protein [Streptomyces chartreusis]